MILALTGALTSWAAGAGTAKGITPLRMVGDKAVYLKTPMTQTQMIEIRNLRLCDAVLEETGAHCTVVAGEVWNMLAWVDFAVNLEIDIYRGSTDVTKIGTAKFHVERPGSKVPVHFSCLIPACYDAVPWKSGCRAWSITRLAVVPPAPPQ
jgi:hypothetical protein